MALRALQGPVSGTPVGGTGTTNYIPRWNPGPSTLGDSGLIDDGTQVYTTTRSVAIGTASSSGWRTRINAPNVAGSAYGVLIDAGSNSADAALQIRGVSGSPTLVYVRGDGNVGIGTASPTGRLHVVGGTAAASTNGAPVTIIAQSGGTGNTNGGSIVLTPGTQAGSGTVGLVDISGPTGTGLKLPATPGNADTQTLDAYQENTWTPTLVLATPGTSSWAYTSQTGRVTRVGRLVFCSFEVKATLTLGTGTGELYVAGLPATAAGITDQMGGAITYSNAFATAPVALLVKQSTTTAYVMKTSAANMAATDLVDATSYTVRGVITFTV